jgi:hypothetical protein
MQKRKTPKDTIALRAPVYGDFTSNAEIAQELKNTVRAYDGQLNHVQRESLDLIFTKIGRILSGDPNHADSWHDIAGYAMLAEERCS